MHPRPAVRRITQARGLDLLRVRSFGTLVVGAPEGALLSRVPVLPDPTGTSADLHLV